MTHLALLLIDLQNDHFDGGRMPLVGAAAAAARAAQLLAAFRRRGDPVFHVQHVSTRAGATFFLPDTDGVRIHSAVAPHAGEPVVVKHFANAFRGTALAERLRAAGATRLLVAGMTTHMGIDTSVRAVADLGCECAVAADACATRELAWAGRVVPAAQAQAAFLAALDGAFARVAPTAELLD